MPASSSTDVLQDDLAASPARALAAANKRACESGVDATQSLTTITQRALVSGMLWRINYGPRDYVGRRGGDLIINVNPVDATIAQVLAGQ